MPFNNTFTLKYETNLPDEINKITVPDVVHLLLSFLHKQYRNDYSEGPEGVKWDWDWPKIWVGKWDLIHWDWDFCAGNGTQNIKWEWEFCFNPLSKKDFFRRKFKQKSNNYCVMEFYSIKKG